MREYFTEQELDEPSRWPRCVLRPPHESVRIGSSPARSAEPSAEPRRRARRRAIPPRRLAARGMVDASDRRQGLWLERSIAGIDTSWRHEGCYVDGARHGLWTTWLEGPPGWGIGLVGMFGRGRLIDLPDGWRAMDRLFLRDARLTLRYRRDGSVDWLHSGWKRRRATTADEPRPR